MLCDIVCSMLGDIVCSVLGDIFCSMLGDIVESFGYRWPVETKRNKLCIARNGTKAK